MSKGSDIWGQIQTVWTNLSIGQRAAAIAVVLAVVGGVSTAALWAGNPEYVQLESGLRASQLPAIIARLEEESIDYYVPSNGGTIMVRREDLMTARRSLARNGLATSSTGRKEEGGIFNTGSMNKRELLYAQTRKLEKLIADNLMAFEFVEHAKVTITPAVDRYFRSGRRPAKANVQLTPRMSLSQHQILSVAHAVAAGVEGLSADDVGISDSRGILLKSPESGNMSGFDPAQLKYRLEVERRKTMQAQEALDLVYGPHKVVVRVSAELDWTRSQVREKKFDPEGKVVRSRMKDESSSSTPTRVPGGRVGANAVTGGAAGAANAAGESSSTTTSTEEMADYDSTESQKITMGGEVKRLSIGVWVDTALATKQEDISRTVGAAVGMMTGRDEIALHVTDITGPESEDIEEAQEAEIASQAVLAYVEYGVYGLLGLAFIFFSLRTIKKAGASLRDVLEQSLEDEKPPEPKPVTLEEAVLDAARGDTELAGRSLRRWLYETSAD